MAVLKDVVTRNRNRNRFAEHALGAPEQPSADVLPYRHRRAR